MKPKHLSHFSLSSSVTAHLTPPVQDRVRALGQMLGGEMREISVGWSLGEVFPEGAGPTFDLECTEDQTVLKGLTADAGYVGSMESGKVR